MLKQITASNAEMLNSHWCDALLVSLNLSQQTRNFFLRLAKKRINVKSEKITLENECGIDLCFTDQNLFDMILASNFIKRFSLSFVFVPYKEIFK